MSEPKKPGAGEIDETPGLAGGPGPTPPGVDDGTTMPRRAEPERMAPPPSAAEQRDEGEAAERSAGPRRTDVPGLADDREGTGETGVPADEKRERRTRR
ncbi:MAG TPA: hypothetical protein VF912_18365 [Anaeromyxobacter sp.]